MGLKGAPGYFQSQLAETVLKGLKGSICELYIDDDIVWGHTEEELVANTECTLSFFVKAVSFRASSSSAI